MTTQGIEEQIQNQFTGRISVYDRRSAWILDAGLLDAIVKTCALPTVNDLLDVCCGTGAVGGAFQTIAKRRGIAVCALPIRTALAIDGA